jgi:type IV pilus assembly protein PilX
MSHPRRQRGAALVVALILLVVATLMALAGSRGSVLQERMSANTYDRSLAFQRSESALRYAESQVLLQSNIATLGGLDCSATPCPLVPANTFTATGAPWRDVTAAFDVNDTNTPGIPQYHIAFMGSATVDPAIEAINAGNNNYGNPPPPQLMAYYRITARSSAPTTAVLGGRSIVVLQSTMRRPL